LPDHLFLSYPLRAVADLLCCSWNGATEVDNWQIWTADNDTGPFLPTPRIKRTGFETRYTLPRVVPYSYVTAWAANDSLLSNSQQNETVQRPPVVRSHVLN
jgi:hypothetical protein